MIKKRLFIFLLLTGILVTDILLAQTQSDLIMQEKSGREYIQELNGRMIKIEFYCDGLIKRYIETDNDKVLTSFTVNREGSDITPVYLKNDLDWYVESIVQERGRILVRYSWMDDEQFLVLNSEKDDTETLFFREYNDVISIEYRFKQGSNERILKSAKKTFYYMTHEGQLEMSLISQNDSDQEIVSIKKDEGHYTAILDNGEGMVLWFYEITGEPVVSDPKIAVINSELISGTGGPMRVPFMFPFIGGMPEY